MNKLSANNWNQQLNNNEYWNNNYWKNGIPITTTGVGPSKASSPTAVLLPSAVCISIWHCSTPVQLLLQQRAGVGGWEGPYCSHNPQVSRKRHRSSSNRLALSHQGILKGIIKAQWVQGESLMAQYSHDCHLSCLGGKLSKEQLCSPDTKGSSLWSQIGGEPTLMPHFQAPMACCKHWHLGQIKLLCR